MTTWWFSWATTDPEEFTLPDCLQRLPEAVATRFKRSKYTYLIHSQLDAVAAAVWQHHEEICLVMMTCFAHRPPERKIIARRRPTVASAREQIACSGLFNDVELKNIALGVLEDKGLFDSETSDRDTEVGHSPPQEDASEREAKSMA
jgi:hypothetical protein